MVENSPYPQPPQMPLRIELVDGKETEIWYDGPIISKADAEAQGLKRYFNMARCVHGHIAERGISNSACVVCGKGWHKMKSMGGDPEAFYHVKIPRGAGVKPKEEEQKEDKASIPESDIEDALAKHEEKAQAQDAETEQEPTQEKDIDPTVRVYGSLSDTVRAVMLRRTKGYTINQLIDLCKELSGEEYNYATVNSVLIKGRADEHVTVAGNKGKALVFKTLPKMFWDLEPHKEKYLAIDSEHKERILLNFEEALKDKGKDKEAIRVRMEEDDLLSDIAEDEEWVMEAAPTALIGRAIVDYINKLRGKSDYTKLKARIDDLVAAVRAYRSKYDDAVTRMRRMSAEINEAKRENHSLKVRESQLVNELKLTKDLLRRAQHGTFSVGEVARIKGELAGLFEHNHGE